MSRPVNKPNRFRRPLLATLICAALAGFSLSGCEETVDVRGNLPHPEVLKSVKVGVTKRSDVENLLGTPSAVSTFKKEIWYYIGSRVKTVSFFTPEVLERKVVTVRFDAKGVVDKVDTRDVPTDKEIELVDRVTPTKGRELTILQQLIGNVGRLSNKGSGDKGG